MNLSYKRLAEIFGVILLSFFLLTFAVWIYGKYTLDQSKKSFLAGIEKDIAYRKDKGDIVAKQEDIKVNLLKNDSYNLLSILGQKKDEYHVGLLAVTNAEGILTVRTVSNNGRGVNVFLVTPQGRAVAHGLSTASIEKSIFDLQQVFMITARPILDKGKMIGSLFASENMDDTYAIGFKSRYLSPGVELAFYSKGVGVYSSTFQKDTEKNLLRLYFNSNSDWVNGKLREDTVRFTNGSTYKIINLPLQGLEATTAGALIFVPIYPHLSQINLALLAGLIFFYLLRRYLIGHHKNRRATKKLLYLLSFLTLVVFLVVLILQMKLGGIPLLKTPPFTIYNSTLRFQPDSGVLTTDFDQSIKVIVDTGGESINTVGINIHYDPSLVTVKQIDTSDSFCNYFIEKKIDEVDGVVTISCGVPTPGLLSPSAVVANLIVTPKKVGGFGFEFSPDTVVLANDGLGTNVLRKSDDASFKTQSSGTSTDPLFLNVYSPSHPNDTVWYSTYTASFLWQKISPEKYNYIFDTASSTLVTKINSTSITQNNIILPIPKDGIFYFHVAVLKNGKIGPTTSYKTQTDTTPPSDVEVKASATIIHSGDTVRLEFSGNDATSGVLSNYYVKINDGGLLLPVKKELYVPFTMVGDNTVTVRLFDRAGNFTEKTITIKVLQ